MLYLYIDKGTFASSPYLDDHGEVDMSMRYVLYSTDTVQGQST